MLQSNVHKINLNRKARRAQGVDKSSPRQETSRNAPMALPMMLADAADAAVEEAFGRTYSPDPLIPARIADIRGPLDSILRRHGHLIEAAISQALELGGAYEVDQHVVVPLSEAALKLCDVNLANITAGLTMPVVNDIQKSAILDLVAYRPTDGRLIVASIKRGGGPQGGSAARQDRLEHRAAAMIVKGMVTARGRPVNSVDVIVIDYYGRSGISAGTLVTGQELDRFFEVPVTGIVEAMTRRVSDGVEKRVSEWLGTLSPPTGPSRSGSHPQLRTERRLDLAFGQTGEAPPSLSECLAGLAPRRARAPKPKGEPTFHRAR